jgi:hypothetical protein
VKLTKEKAQESLNKLLSMFESGEFPQAVALTVIRQPGGRSARPSDKWSLGNQILMLMHDTTDARGFKQWEAVGRKVKKSAKAFHILAPVIKTRTVRVRCLVTGAETDEARQLFAGFTLIPVFRIEDTEGGPVDDVPCDPPELPPLHHVARLFGVESVRYVPAGNGEARGSYTWGGGTKRIVLSTHDLKTWFHELGHAVHHSFKPLKGGQHPEQEIVAEVFAAAMCELHGINGYEQHAWDYVRAFVAGQSPDAALRAVFSALSDVEKCLELVLACETPDEGRCIA